MRVKGKNDPAAFIKTTCGKEKNGQRTDESWGGVYGSDAREGRVQMRKSRMVSHTVPCRLFWAAHETGKMRIPHPFYIDAHGGRRVTNGISPVIPFFLFFICRLFYILKNIFIYISRLDRHFSVREGFFCNVTEGQGVFSIILSWSFWESMDVERESQQNLQSSDSRRKVV